MLPQSPSLQSSHVSPITAAAGASDSSERRSGIGCDYRLTPAASDGPVLLVSPDQVAYLRELLRRAYEDYSLGALRPSNLAVLIRLNALNAVARNAVLMGFPAEGLCRDDFESPYTEAGPRLPQSQIPAPACPKMLMPTALQRTVQHHPWLDLLPFPAFRDNMLRALDAGIFDDDELCEDVLNVGSEDLGEKPALIVWGESSDSGAWEANVPFLRKWGWLLRGCAELIEATNYWREKRGEKRLRLDVS